MDKGSLLNDGIIWNLTSKTQGAADYFSERIDAVGPNPVVTPSDIKTFFSIPQVSTVRDLVKEVSTEVQTNKIQSANIPKKKFPLWVIPVIFVIILITRKG